MQNSPFERLRKATSAYQEPAVLAAAAELDVFTEILKRNTPPNSDEIAETLLTDRRGTAVLLDTLAALGYLEKSPEGRYSVTGDYRGLLDSRTPETFVPMIRHLACVQRAWVRLTWTVKDGTPPEIPPSLRGAERDYDSFIMAMNAVARGLAGPTVESLQEAGVLDFGKEDVRFLDIGGASGTYTQAFLDAKPGWRGAVFDLPPGIAQARNRFAGSPYENRVELFEGDFYRDTFPDGFDFAWISAIIHQHGREESRALYEKARNALDPGGLVAVRDFIMDASRTKPLAGAFFGVNMLVETKTGKVYTFAEVREDLEAAGFTDVRLAVPAETMSAVVVARK